MPKSPAPAAPGLAKEDLALPAANEQYEQKTAPLPDTIEEPTVDLSDLRRQIDELDSRLLELLNQRASLAVEIGRRKAAATTDVFAPERERHVLDHVLSANAGPLPAESVRNIYTEIISSMRALEKPLTIAYWGPPATNTHLASVRKFGSSSSFIPQDTIADVFEEVQRRQADFGVVPIENSIEGIVNHTLDMFLRSDMRICAEVYLEIFHGLLSRAQNLSEVRRIYSIPVATAQCRNWLSAHMRGVEIIDASTTARAAMLAAEDPSSGAIAGEMAAQVYGLNVLAEHIEDNPGNKTRFLAVGRLEPNPSGRDKTSLVFSVPHRSGSLLHALQVFSDADINLTLIESRPTKQMPWEYVFYVDAQGHQTSPNVSAAIQKLRDMATFVKVLGSYPEAD